MYCVAIINGIIPLLFHIPMIIPLFKTGIALISNYEYDMVYKVMVLYAST